MSSRHNAVLDGRSRPTVAQQEGGRVLAEARETRILTDIVVSQQVEDAWEEFATNGFMRSEAQERLLAGDDPQNSNLDADSNPIITLPETPSGTAGLRLKDYAPKTLWNSVWLHKVVLFGFCALFTALFSALILLYHFSNVHHGLSTESSKNKYGWTYGPTASEFSSTSTRPQSFA